MGARILAWSIRHQALLTGALLFGLLVNLMVIGTVDPPSEGLDGDLPAVAQCQGGSGPGCVEQPLIPPPAIGLPRFEQPVPIVFGMQAEIHEVEPDVLREAPPARIDHPPLSVLAA